MTPEEKRQGAFQEFDELLAQSLPVGEAIIRAAEGNELRPDHFHIIAQKELGDLHDHARKVQLRVLNEAIAAEVRLASSKRRPGTLFDDCYDPDEVAAEVGRRIGRDLSEDEVPKIHEARREFVHRQVQELVERLG